MAPSENRIYRTKPAPKANPSPAFPDLKTETVNVLELILSLKVECSHLDTTEKRRECPWCRARFLLDAIKLKMV